MNVVDSCGWLEYLADGANAEFFEPALLDEAALLVPAITLFEVMRAVLRQRGPAAAETALGFMTRGKVADLDAAGLPGVRYRAKPPPAPPAPPAPA